MAKTAHFRKDDDESTCVARLTAGIGVIDVIPLASSAPGRLPKAGRCTPLVDLHRLGIASGYDSQQQTQWYLFVVLFSVIVFVLSPSFSCIDVIQMSARSHPVNFEIF